MTRTGGEVEVVVWDRFVRLFHWTTVLLIAALFLTQDSRQFHIPLGYAVVSLLAARCVWGVAGSKHARFADFVPGAGTLGTYLRSLRSGNPRRYLGHNPAGGAMVVVLLILILATSITGWLSQTDRYFGDDAVSGAHSTLSSILLIAVGLHVAGVVASSMMHRENLVRAMLTGRKLVQPVSDK